MFFAIGREDGSSESVDSDGEAVDVVFMALKGREEDGVWSEGQLW